MADLTTEKADEILKRAITQLAEGSQITRLRSGSKARSLLNILSTEIERMEEVLSANMILSLVNGASGVYLDFLGELLGQPRNRASTATVSSEAQVVRIYTPTGRTAGGMNNGNSIVIPGGTIVESSDAGFKFATVGTYVLGPTDTEVFVGVRSINFGPDANVSSGVLSEISFENYASFPETLLLVENTAAIETGASEEGDDFYRYRIRNALLSAEKANATAIRLAALSVPSVSDVIILDQFRGVGTADVLLDTVSGEVGVSTLIQSRDAVDLVRAVGSSINVRAPKLAGLEIELSLKFRREASNGERANARNAVRTAISNLIARVPIGGELRVNDIAFAVKEADENIIDVGEPNKPLGRVILWRESPVYGRSPVRLQPRRDIELRFDERLTLERSLTEAIRIV